jgi:O-antigen ligase
VSWIAPIVLFLVYLNAPAVAVRVHGAPFFLGAAVPLALGIPIAHRVLVRGEDVRFPNVLLAALAMWMLHCVSGLASIRPFESVEILETWLLEGLLLALLVANAVRTRAEVRAAVMAVVAAGAVMGGIALAQQWLGPETHSFAGFGQLDAAIGSESGEMRRRLAGPIGETNRFAQIMAVLIPLAAGCALVSRGRERAAWTIAGLLIVAGMAFAFSRGAVVALAAALPFALGFRMVRFRHVAITVAAAVCLLAVMPHYAERVISIGEVAMRSLGVGPVGMRNADGAARGRLTEMKAAGMLFLDHPLLGAGPGLAPYYYGDYAGVTGGKVRAGGRRSHNLFLQLAAETGIVGLSAFALVLGIVFRDLDRARRRLEQRDRGIWAIVCGLELALIVSLVASVFLHAAYIRYFWLLIGLATAASTHQGAPVLVTLLARMFQQTAARIRADA